MLCKKKPIGKNFEQGWEFQRAVILFVSESLLAVVISTLVK